MRHNALYCRVVFFNIVFQSIDSFMDRCDIHLRINTTVIIDDETVIGLPNSNTVNVADGAA